MNSDDPLKPASLLKLVTSAAALETLGPDRVFTTTVQTYDAVEKGTLQGDLIVVGGGDPSLGPRFQEENPSNVSKVLDDWAADLKKRGIRRVQGNVLGDDRRYEEQPLAIGWDPTEYAEWYSAEVSALCYNDNCIDIIWTAGGKQGKQASFRLNPDTKYVTVGSSVRVGPERQKEAQLRYYRFKDANEIRARGTMPQNSEKYDFAAVHDPARFTAHLFMDALRRQGIQVDGNAFNRRAIELDDNPTSEPLVLIRHDSPPLRKILPIINGNSQNLYAELMTRETALAMNQPASFEGGSRAVNEWLRQHELQRNGFVMVDGSGLSPINKVPAKMLAGILRYMNESRLAELYRDSLAVPGTRSLRNRFQAEKYAPLRDNLRAKTGYIEGSHGIAGFMSHVRGSEYIFVVMLNDYDERKSDEGRNLVDDIVLLIQQSDVLP
jgi:D-alanyl-D-alanine carboxypeptidase/D-alanyl-D-alanine-endopeptidase (penicillin-binding protein 4)